MVSRFEPSAVSSNASPSFFDVPDRAMQRTAILAQHLFPISDCSAVASLQLVPVVGPNTQPNRNNNAKAPPRAQPNSRPQPAKARPNPPSQRAAPPQQRPAAQQNPPRPVAQPAPTHNNASQLAQKMQQVQSNLAALSKLCPPANASAPKAPSPIPARAAPTITPATPAPNLQKPPQQNFSNLAASRPNPSTPVSFTQPSSAHPNINSHSQPAQIQAPSVTSAPKQISSPPVTSPSSASTVSSIPQSSFAAEPPKPFTPMGPEPASNVSTVPPPAGVTLTIDPLKTAINTPVQGALTPAEFAKAHGYAPNVNIPPTQSALAAQSNLSAPAEPLGISGAKMLAEIEAKSRAGTNPAAAPIKTPVAANLTPPVPTSLVPALSPIVQKGLESAYPNNEAVLARTSNLVNQLREASPVRTPAAPVKDDSFIDYSLGFFKGLKNGVKESATDFIPGMVNAVKTLGNFTYETITRPIEHTKEVYAAIEETIAYVKTHDLGEIGQKLAPEVHKLVTEWDTLPSAEKGELTGYCIGKYGTDLALTAGALKGVKIAATAVRTEVAVGAAVKEAVVVSNASKAVAAGEAIAGTVEARAVAQEVKAVTRAVNTVETRAGSAASATGAEVEARAAAHNRAMHEKYKTLLRAEMEKPQVVDPILQKEIDKIYRPAAEIGSGSTAAAIRAEKMTGEPVKGKWHLQKGEESVKNLEKWLKNNPTATPGDRAAAENILKDLKNALE